MLNVVIIGGSGLIGSQLAELLINNNYCVTILSRSNKKTRSNNIKYSIWNIKNKLIDVKVITQAHYIIHLAGEGIADKRWTKQRKLNILTSRTVPLQLIYELISTNENNLKALISASGIGFYGAITTNHVFTENDAAANDFLGQTCQQWENEVDRFNELNIRTVKLRTGIVLSNRGGALPKMARMFKLGFGSPIGTGKQFLPWIHIHDLCHMYLFAIKNSNLIGAYNAVVQDDTTNYSFSKNLAKSFNKKMWLPNVPSFILKLVMGEMASLLLYGSRVSNEKIKALGFKFKLENLQIAIAELIRA